MIWLYGRHAVLAALENPRRHIAKIMLSNQFKGQEAILSSFGHFKIEMSEMHHFASRFGADAVHQGIAVQTEPLNAPHLDDLLQAHEGDSASLLVLLDQVTDPHNVGAITRSAAAFGAHGLIVPKHQSAPNDSAILAKTACGGIEHVPLLTVTNLARTMDHLKQRGYWCIGLDERGEMPIHKAPLTGKIALILGAEGSGLRRLTKDTCDVLTQLPTSPAFPTLNVSNAAALAFYEFNRQNNVTLE